MPLVLITMPLIILPMSPGVELSLGNSLIPITGIVLLLRTVLEGNYVEALAYFPLVAAVTLACCLWAVRWATEQFNTESVLFRESERLDLGLWLRHLMRDREDTPTAAEAVFCGVLILLIRFFLGFAIPAPRDFDGFTRIAVITQLVVIATPALLMAVMLTRSPAKTLLLRWPAWQVLPAVLLLAAATHPVATSLQALVRWIYPMSEDVKRELAKLMGQAPQHQFWFLLLVIAVIPAICEELAFRGFVLSGLRHLGRKWRAIAISSLFFGVTHAIFQQSLVACLVGAVIGYVAVQTESIFPAMLFHASHNSLALLSSQIDSDMLDRHPAFRWAVSSTAADGTMYHWSVVLGAAILMAALLVWFSKLPYAKSSEESLQEAIDHSSSRDLEGALFKTPPLRSESSV
jgi:sodium transport system permease protein